MTIRVGKMTFKDWVALRLRDQFTDTFVFRISASACLPPFVYAPLLERMAAHLRAKRSCASLWVQVDAPGEWFLLEVRNSLRGLKIPHVVSHKDAVVQYADFSYRPILMPETLKHPPVVEISSPVVNDNELQCLRTLGRMEKGTNEEIASLAGLPATALREVLERLEKRKLVVTVKDDGEPKSIQPDESPLWQLKYKGLSVALRSWDVPKGVQFTSRKEEHVAQLGTDHRHRARMWSAWLKAAYPNAAIWAAWSEVRLPEIAVVPDGLAWGKIHGRETLFWLEVGDEHKSSRRITDTTAVRLARAMQFCNRTGVNLVYAQLGPRWVCEAVRWACTQLPENVAVVLGNSRIRGKLPVIEWGEVTSVEG